MHLTAGRAGARHRARSAATASRGPRRWRAAAADTCPLCIRGAGTASPRHASAACGRLDDEMPS